MSPKSQLLNSLKRESRKISSVPKLTTLSSAVHAANKDNKKTIFAAGAALEIGGEIDGVLKNKNNVLLRRAWCLAQLNEFGPAQMDLDMIEVIQIFLIKHVFDKIPRVKFTVLRKCFTSCSSSSL